MNFTFTERHATIASRFVEVHIDKWLEKVEAYKKMDPNELKDKYISIENGYISLDGLSINTRIDKHDYFILVGLIAFNPEYDDEEELESVEVDGLMIKLSHRMYKDDDYVNAFKHELGNYYINTLEEAKQKLNKAVKTYQYCKCNEHLPVKDGWCGWCYPFITEQDDNCSVCLENSGLWVELKCKHKIHEHCFKKIENKKCPLCRKVSDKILRL
jgi:hypothetical protein